jgi:hypothetical protein
MCSKASELWKPGNQQIKEKNDGESKKIGKKRVASA